MLCSKYFSFPQVLSAQQNQAMSVKIHIKRLGCSSGSIRTSCCAARRPAAESLCGWSRVRSCCWPRATGESRGCSPPDGGGNERASLADFPLKTSHKSQFLHIYHQLYLHMFKAGNKHVLTVLLTCTISWPVLLRWRFRTVISTQALSVFLVSST